MANFRSILVAVIIALIGTGSAWADLTDGLIAHWKFDEGSGNTAYDSAGSNDGTIYGAKWAKGHFGSALRFNGVSDYVNLGNDRVKHPLPLTISAWIKLDSVDGHKRIVTLDNQSGTYYGVWFIFRDNGDTIEINYGDGTGGGGPAYRRSKTGTTALIAGQWYHVAAVIRDSTDMDLYINGIDDGGSYSGTGGNLAYSTHNSTIGGQNFGDTGFFNGLIDEIRIYNRPLSGKEVWNLYHISTHELTELKIVGPDDVAENSQAGYKVIAVYDDDSTRDVTDLAKWSVEPNDVASIDAGQLSTEKINLPKDVRITAQYSEGDVDGIADKDVSIFAICPRGSALQFDGIDDYVTLSDLAVTTTEFTISAWANQYGPGRNLHHQNTIFSQRDDTTGDNHCAISLLSNTDDDAYAAVRSSNGMGNIITYPTMSYNQWHQYAMTVDKNNLIFYIDGMEVGSKLNTQTGDYTTAIDYVTIGRLRFQGKDQGFFNGAIDEFRVYDRALSSDEIRAGMHTKPKVDPNLVVYYDFDEGQGQEILDTSGHSLYAVLGSNSDIESSDPCWVDSDAPVGICGIEGIVEKNLSEVWQAKLAILEQLYGAIDQEEALLGYMDEKFKNRDFGNIHKRDVVKAKQNIHSAIQYEKLAGVVVDRSFNKLDNAMRALGIETKDFEHNNAINCSYTKKECNKKEPQKPADAKEIKKNSAAKKKRGK